MNLKNLEILDVLVILVGVKFDLLEVDRPREELVHELAVGGGRAQVFNLQFMRFRAGILLAGLVKEGYKPLRTRAAASRSPSQPVRFGRFDLHCNRKTSSMVIDIEFRNGRNRHKIKDPVH